MAAELRALVDVDPLAKSAQDLSYVRGRYVVIDATSTDPQGLLASLQGLGLQEGAVYKYMVSGLLPISSIPQLETLPGLRMALPAAASSGTGSVTSEGDAAMLADDARMLYGLNGNGITVGTLSDSYDCISPGNAATNVTTNDLPAGVTVLSDLASGCIDEGRAMMQIIHDVAPGVNQAFHTAFNGQADFAQGIEELAGCPAGSSAGCTAVAGLASDVVNDDVFYFAEPFFQDGVIAQAVDNVVSNGVAYFALAGNHARESYQAPFNASGVTGPGGGGLHDFDPGPGVDVSQRISVPAGRSVNLSFQWVDRYASISGAPGAGTDLDIYILDTAGNVVAQRTTANAGGDPIELFSPFTNPGTIDANGDGIPDTGFDVQIELASGPAPLLVKYIALVNGPIGNFTQLEWDTQSSTVYGHMNSNLGLVIGAAYYQNTPEFGTDPPQVEAFSSAGGTAIYFDVNGNPVAPVLRTNPDVVAPDGGNNTFFGGDRDGDGQPNFSGTSAATPHAAAVGALLLEAAGGSGSLAPATLFAALTSTAIDMDDPLTPGFDTGFDFRTGVGLINALQALHLYQNVPPVANAGSDQEVECSAAGEAEVTLDGSASSDPEGDPLTYTWRIGSTVIAGPSASPTALYTFPLGSTTVELTVSDGTESSTDEVIVDVVDTTPPALTLNGPAEITLECSIDAYTELGATATDVCDPNPSITITGSVDVTTPGEYPITYTATDASGNQSTEVRTVRVTDTTPPVVAVADAPLQLWPPNHTYRTLSLDDLALTATDVCDAGVGPAGVQVTQATSDEPEDLPDGGDGATVNDIQITTGTCRAVALRAERQGGGNGRVYTHTLGIADASGNVGTTTYDVFVPASRRPSGVVVNDGPAYLVAPAACALTPAAVVAEASPGAGAKAGASVTEYALTPAAPNPFARATEVVYAVPDAAHVQITVYDVLGRAVASLVDAPRAAGRYATRFDAQRLPSGTYFIRMTTSTGFTRTQQVTLVR